MPGKLVVVSNRGPYVIRGRNKERAVGGLVTAVEPVVRATKGTWVAWGGREGGSGEFSGDGAGYSWREVPLSREEIHGYYYGFANRVLWPLCHCLVEKCEFSRAQWRVFVEVNRKFAHIAAGESAEADLVWVHDYHLPLVPAVIRRQLKNQKIAFFWHIPFPPRDVFAILPWAREILAGLLGSHLIGFHASDYVENFCQCARDLLGARVDPVQGWVEYQGRRTWVRAVPIGIDVETFETHQRGVEVAGVSRRLREMLGVEKLALSVDRLDYSKGIPERLAALELLWERHPEYRGRLSFIQIAVPTRTEVEAYRLLKRQVEEAVGRINGRFSDGKWLPVYYLYRGFSQAELALYYAAADVALVTPLRDGLNLVAKEYLIARGRQPGVLVLSKFAGAAAELREALLVNPYDVEDMVAKIRLALEMPGPEQLMRLHLLQQRVRRRDLRWWVSSFLAHLETRDAAHHTLPRSAAAGREQAY